MCTKAPVAGTGSRGLALRHNLTSAKVRVSAVFAGGRAGRNGYRGTDEYRSVLAVAGSLLAHLRGAAVWAYLGLPDPR
jgi:hypothetical protein